MSRRLRPDPGPNAPGKRSRRSPPVDPPARVVPHWDDASLRRQLAIARAAGKVGVR